MDANIIDTLKKKLPFQRWFRQKNSEIKNIVVLDSIQLPSCEWLWIECITRDGVCRTYSVPVARNRFADNEFAVDLLHALSRNNPLRTKSGGTLEAQWFTPRPPVLPSRSYSLRSEMSNTICVMGNKLAIKLYRSPEKGINPEVEMNAALLENYAHTPRFYGHVTYITARGRRYELAVMQEFIQHASDLWTFLLHALAKKNYTATYPVIRACGRALGTLHNMLASMKNKRFAPLRCNTRVLTAWSRNLQKLANDVRIFSKNVPGGKFDFRALEATMAGVRTKLARITRDGKCIRQHGDFHLGQVLVNAQKRLFIIDFEGEPLVPLSERLGRFLPLKDVAGLTRSLHYASHAARIQGTSPDPVGLRAWYEKARETFLNAYFSATGTSSFLPRKPYEMLEILELEKALYELKYEALNRPAWLAIPIEGIHEAIREITNHK